ncbi:MAG: hypothetical protein HY818_04110 [Acetobacterium woodii]|nr:hypothetical protein [Acetobacterium woodii]
MNGSYINKELFKDLWYNGIITFDTCSMGRMYEWEYEQAINIKDVLSYLFMSGHLWETEYNCEEFNIQRELIKNSIFHQKYENGIFKHLKKRPIPWNKIDGTLNRWEGRGYNSIFIDELKKLRSSKNITDDKIEKLRLIVQNLSSHPDADDLFDAILKKDNISLSEEEKLKLIERYNSGEACPGSGDNNKHNGKQYNDLFIWELIKKKAFQTNIDMIFVTSDTTKSDWFVDDAPREDFIVEFQRETGKNIMILTLVQFWECCQPYIDLPVKDFILQSTILAQLQEKFDDCYEQQICDKMNQLIFESDEIISALEDSLDCCVDMPVFDQIDDCKIVDVYPFPYEDDAEFVSVTIEMIIEITFDALNHTAGEDWSAGSDSILFNIVSFGSIPVKWSSGDTKRIVLKDLITVDVIEDVTVISKMHSDGADDFDENDDCFDVEDNFLEDKAMDSIL